MRMYKVCLLLLAGLVSVNAASFTKRYPSPNLEDATIFRFNRSRIQQWRHKCRRQRVKSRVISSSLSSQRRTAGTRLFWGKPSLQAIAHKFWEASVPVFNHANAGDLTNPLLSATSATTTTALVASTTTPTSSSNSDNTQWWPSIPYLSLTRESSASDMVPSQSRPLWDGCDAVFQYLSRSILSRRVLRYRMHVGEGVNCYEQVRDFALNWEFDGGDKGIRSVPACPQKMAQSWRSVHPLEGTTGSADRTERFGRRMVSWTKFGPFQVCSPIAVIYECVDQRGAGRHGARALYTSCAYATQRGHWISGEERVTVVCRDESDDAPCPVEVEILSISRAAPSIMGRLAWPFIGPMQDKFFVEQLRALKRSARTRTSDQTPRVRSSQSIFSF